MKTVGSQQKKTNFIGLLQEICPKNPKEITRSYKVYDYHGLEGARAAVVTSKKVESFFLKELSSTDVVAVKINTDGVETLLMSAYLDITFAIEGETLRKVVKI